VPMAMLEAPSAQPSTPTSTSRLWLRLLDLHPAHRRRVRARPARAVRRPRCRAST
jgi:hypothetical protein